MNSYKMKIFPLEVNRSKNDIFIVTLSLLLFIYRTVNPIFLIPFILVYFSFCIYFVFLYWHNSIRESLTFIRRFYLIFILLVILILSFVFSDKFYLTVFKEIVNTTILISLFFILSILVTSKNDLKILAANFINLLVCFSLIISILGLLDLFSVIEYKTYSITGNVSSTPWDDSFQVDYNFAVLPVFFGVIGVFYLLVNKNRSVFQKTLFYISLIIYSLSILLSGSRRGFIIFAVTNQCLK